MIDASQTFRTKLMAELKVKMASKQTEAIGAIRAIMSAMDNASAIPKEEIAGLPPSTTEVPRKLVTKENIEHIISAEIEMRTKAVQEYERLGNTSEADKLRQSLITLEALKSLL